ncbi:hypothetical protein [Anaerobaca lacustris]|uniref:Uncharacterized protein n=1 Tax=Anaerobaca lacustris TaxID=3044600 RepID=A0AAW6U2W4_9BACT|nr:hypothetical protein [Sedimentisphaerales bacterium M17dextr]
MFAKYREAHDLAIDYGEALREGSLPTFLKSLSRFEAREVIKTPTFRHGAEMVRLVNGVAFADEIALPSVDIFLARVHARIASRARRAHAAPRVGMKRNVSGRNPQQ